MELSLDENFRENKERLQEVLRELSFRDISVKMAEPSREWGSSIFEATFGICSKPFFFDK